MSERLVVYSCHENQQEHNDAVRHVRDFVRELNTCCANGDSVQVVNGNEEFAATRYLLREAVLSLRQADGSCPFDDGFREFVHTAKAYSNGSRRHADGRVVSADQLRMVSLWAKHATGEIASSLSDKVVVVSDETVTSITEARRAHGIAEFCGDVCFLVRVYKNILWHEAAHLFGARDHYDDNHRATQKCKAPNLCLMQWDPGDKKCEFCAQSIKEMQTYFAERKAGQKLLAERMKAPTK